MSDALEEYGKSSWQIHPRLDLPGSPKPPLVFALLAADPLPAFRERLKGPGVTDVLAHLPQAAEEHRRLMVQGLLTAAWDGAFRAITGDQVYLLPDDSPQGQTVLSRGEQGFTATATATFTSVGSTAPAGEMWLVTKALRHGDRLLSWSLPVKTVRGRMVTATLSLENAADLEHEWAVRPGST